MMSSARTLIFLATIAGLFASGCISKTIRVPADQQLYAAQTKSRSELIQGLQERSKAISTMTATKIGLDVASRKPDQIKEYLQFPGIIVVDRPSQVRLRVLAPVVGTTVADMVSDGRQYKVSIPPKNQFGAFDATAPATSDNALLNLRPQIILDSLFVDVLPHMSDARIHDVLEEVTSGRVRYYVFSFIDASAKDGKLLEKIWIDRRSLEVSKKQVFGKDGRLETDVDYSGYQIVDGLTFPQVISIQRPADGYSVKLTFQAAQIRFNEKLNAEAFVLERPAGSELIQVHNATTKPFLEEK